MIVRNLIPEDIPKLKALYESQGYGYEFPDLTGPRIEAVTVIADEEGNPIMAAAAERIPQIYLWCGQKVPPAAMKRCVQMLHESMAVELRKAGYSEANAFLPPEVAKRFGRWLVRRFSWMPSWKCFGIQF